MSKTICVLYGINEGPHIGNALVAACKKSGFDLVSDVSAADVIFAHSGGCFLIPENNHARLIVLVNLPYWPGKSWVAATAVKVWRDYKLNARQHTRAAWGVKFLYNVLYAFNLKPALRMAKERQTNRPWNTAQRQVIIRNREDVYASWDILNIAFNGPRTFVSLSGEHDDCWSNPKTYVDILNCGV